MAGGDAPVIRDGALRNFPVRLMPHFFLVERT
jgi:hypothetical protein